MGKDSKLTCSQVKAVMFTRGLSRFPSYRVHMLRLAKIGKGVSPRAFVLPTPSHEDVGSYKNSTQSWAAYKSIP